MIVRIVGEYLSLYAGGVAHVVVFEDRGNSWMDALKLAPVLAVGHLLF